MTETKTKYFSHDFKLCTALAVACIIFMLSLGIYRGNNMPLSMANETAQDIQRLAQEATISSIFFNNFVLCTLPVFIPGFGIVWELFVEYNTGLVFGLVARAYNASASQLTIATLFSPVGILEYSSYFLTLGESLTLCYYMTQKNGIALKDRIKKHSWKTLLLSAILLLIGAVVEYANLSA